MKEADVLITKEYNHMNFENLGTWFSVTFGFHSFNFLLGIVTAHDIQMISGLASIVMQLIYFLVNIFHSIRNNVKPSKNDIEKAAFERRCVGCAEKFEPEHADHIFCKESCKVLYMNELNSRKPFIKKSK